MKPNEISNLFFFTSRVADAIAEFNIQTAACSAEYELSSAQKLSGPTPFKNFKVHEGLNLQVTLEAINAFNTPFFGTPNGVSFANNNSIKPDGSLMGEIRTLATSMRTVQLGMKLQW